MAKITCPITILSVDGRVASAIFARRNRIPFVRRPYPSAAPSPAQRRSRDAFALVDLRWRQLTPTLKQKWRDYQSWRRNYGYNRFQRINIPRVLSGLPIIDDPDNI